MKGIPTGWFLGVSELDYCEWSFDGTIMEPPSAEEQDLEASPEGREKGFIAECFTVAEGIRDMEYACMMCAAPDLLTAGESLLDFLRDQCVLPDGPNGSPCWCGDDGSCEACSLRAAITKAYGGKAT